MRSVFPERMAEPLFQLFCDHLYDSITCSFHYDFPMFFYQVIQQGLPSPNFLPFPNPMKMVVSPNTMSSPAFFFFLAGLQPCEGLSQGMDVYVPDRVVFTSVTPSPTVSAFRLVPTRSAKSSLD